MVHKARRLTKEARTEIRVLKEGVKDLRATAKPLKPSYAGGVKGRLIKQTHAIEKTIRKIQRTGRGSREWRR